MEEAVDDLDDKYLQEYEEVEIMERLPTPYLRTATGRVIKGSDCEYIKIGSITANTGCTDGKDEAQAGIREDERMNTITFLLQKLKAKSLFYFINHFYVKHNTNTDYFREQVCDKASLRCEEAVPDPEWRGHPWLCHQGEEICQLFILHRDHR